MLQMPVDEVIDPHIHLFDLRGTPRPMQPLGRLFGWNERLLRAVATRVMPKEAVAYFGERTPLLGDYLPEQFRNDARTSGVGRYVHIQAGWTDTHPLDPVGETAWLAGLPDGPAGIVGHADLTLGAEVDQVLRAHLEASERVRGIRHMLAWHPAPGVMDFATDGRLATSTAFRAGVSALGRHGLTFDAWCYSHQLSDLASLAADLPEVDMVLCHAGTPVGYAGEYCGVGVSAQERARIGDVWREGVALVAANPNVRCKLSGLLMPAVGFGFERAAVRPRSPELVDRLSPLVDHCIESFGPDRCMIASNFPVDRVSADYETITRAMLDMTHRHGEDAQMAMFAGTAEAFYRL